jgi:hypothetical protein
MPVKLNRFVSEVIRPAKWARKYNFDIEFMPPPGMSLPDYQMQSLLMRCESMVIPGQNISTSTDDIRIGPAREHAIGVTYGPVQATFLCSPDLRERTFFEDWQAMVFDADTYQVNYYKDYVTDMSVSQYDDEGKKSYQCKLFEVFPKGVMPQEVAIGDGEFHRLSVELVYHHWKQEEVPFVPSSTAETFT